MHTDILLVALNAKFSHTNLALRYLRESCCQAGLGKPKLLELTINNYIPEMLGQILNIILKFWDLAVISGIFS